MIGSRHTVRPFTIPILGEDWLLRVEAAQACIQGSHYLGSHMGYIFGGSVLG